MRRHPGPGGGGRRRGARPAPGPPHGSAGPRGVGRVGRAVRRGGHDPGRHRGHPRRADDRRGRRTRREGSPRAGAPARRVVRVGDHPLARRRPPGASPGGARRWRSRRGRSVGSGRWHSWRSRLRPISHGADPSHPICSCVSTMSSWSASSRRWPGTPPKGHRGVTVTTWSALCVCAVARSARRLPKRSCSPAASSSAAPCASSSTTMPATPSPPSSVASWPGAATKSSTSTAPRSRPRRVRSTRRPGDPATLTIRALRHRRPFAKYSYARRLLQELEYGVSASRAIRALQPDVVISANTPLLSQWVMNEWLGAHRIPLVGWVQDLYSDAVRTSVGRGGPRGSSAERQLGSSAGPCAAADR